MTDISVLNCCKNHKKKKIWSKGCTLGPIYDIKNIKLFYF